MPADHRAVIRAAIAEVAPEADLDGLGPDEELRDALDLDSMDFLSIVVAVSEDSGLDIPERAYPEITTLSRFAAYLDARVAATAG